MESIESLPLSAISESPFNPRKQYPEGELQELADSIRDQGVMQPIVVRIQPEELVDMHFRYQIIFGHRRFRAASLAGLEYMPCIVRTMDDEACAIAQIHENMKRRDILPLDEADSFVHLRDGHRMKAAAIAQAVGKTLAYVYARLKLATAAPEVRKAVADDGLSPEVALCIGRLPHHDLQRLALGRMTTGAVWPHRMDERDAKTWLSTREANAALKTLFSTNLDDAHFDLDDAELAASAGACTTCKRRAGNIGSAE